MITMIDKEDFFAALSRVTGQAADRLGKIKPEQAWEAINLIQEEDVSLMFNDLEKKMQEAEGVVEEKVVTEEPTQEGETDQD